MSHGPLETRPFTTAYSRPVLALGALLVAASCDKLAPRENVTPLAQGNTSPGGGTSDGGGFTPRRDSGIVGPGEQPGEIGDDGGVDTSPDASDPSGDAEVPADTTASCGELPADGAFSKAALLASVAQCTTHYYCQFEFQAQRFARVARAFAEVPSDGTRADAQEAWYEATRAWEIAELFEFGPGALIMEPGGRALGAEIDSFPLVSRCTVEENLAEASYNAPTFGTSSTNGRGLAAIEYALFFTGAQNACSQINRINTQGTWAALSAGQLAQRKAEFTGASAAVIAERATTLLNAWDPAGDDFSHQLSQPGLSSVYTNEQTALNAVSNALFFIDKELKDSKVAVPGGLMSCTENCASLAESPYARVGKDFIADNLRGFRLIFQGCGEDFAGIGFDDWLRSVGRGDIADDMLAGLANAEAALAAIDRIEDAFVNDRPKIEALHAAIKTLTDILKVDFITVLNLERPMSSEGDND